MKLTIYRTSENDKNRLITIENCVWGILPAKYLQTLFLSVTETQDITPEKAESLKQAVSDFAWQKLIHWLSLQEHSTYESRQYLSKFRFHHSIIDACLSKAHAHDYINDQRYCRLLIESLLEKKKSLTQIKNKLIEKHLPPSIWEPILEELSSPEIKQAILEQQAEKTYRKYAHLDKKNCQEKCLTALYRKGFDLEEAAKAIYKLMHKKN